MTGEEQEVSPIDILREAIAFYQHDDVPPEDILVQTTLDVINAVEATAFVRGYEAALSSDDEARILYEQYLRDSKPGEKS